MLDLIPLLHRAWCVLLLTLIQYPCQPGAASQVTPEAPLIQQDIVFQGHCDSVNPCHQMCINQAGGGYHCECQPGYYLHANGFSCMDEGATASAMDDELEAGHAPEDEVFDTSDENKPDGIFSDEVDLFDDILSNEKNDDLMEQDDEDENEKALSAIMELSPSLTDMMMGDAPTIEDEDDDVDDLTDTIETDAISSAESEIEKLAAPEKRQLLYMKDDARIKESRRDRNSTKSRNRSKSDRRKNRKGKGRKNSKNGRRKNKDRTNAGDSQQADSIGANDVILYEMEEENRHQLKEQVAKFNRCSELQCQSGGHCVPDTMRGGVRCQCPLGTTGDFCERDLVVKYPMFLGTGYLAFPMLRGAARSFKITIEFRPDTPNGLLLFSAEHATARSDFFSISLVDHHAEFRFDCGTGPAVLTTANRVELNEWNMISVHRTESSGWIQLNEGEQVKGKSKGLFRMISFRENLYLGGYFNTSLIGRRTAMQWGFVGCVRNLEINTKVYDMRKGAFVGDALSGMDVGECSANVCDNTHCLNEAICSAASADTAVCLCPMGFAGDRCETAIDIYVPEFTGRSYLQHLGLRRTVLSYAKIEIVFKPSSPDGLIFYNGYSTDKTGDFISLALKHGYLEFRFDLGTGPAIIRSREKLALDVWHEARCIRSGKDGTLLVDNEAAVRGVSKGDYSQLTLTLDLFIGGHRNYDEVARNAAISTSFEGCIQKLIINEHPYDLVDSAREGVNIGSCSHTCSAMPCENGGKCIPAMDRYTCICSIGYTGDRCETADDAFRFRYRFKRDIREVITTPMFTGNSYLMYVDQEMITRTRGNKFSVQMKIRTDRPSGLIFWTASKGDGDYLAVGIEHGYAVFGFNLGSGEIIISHTGKRLDDGYWHMIKAERYNKMGYLEIDGSDAVEGTAPGNLVQLSTYPEIYIGGLNNTELGTSGRYHTGFTGCIANVTLATDYRVNLMGEVAQSRDVKQCST